MYYKAQQFLILLAFVSTFTVSALSQSTLYVVSATPSGKLAVELEPQLLRLDPSTFSTVKVATLAQGKGVAFINTAYDSRTMVLAYPSFHPSAVETISFDSPLTRSTAQLSIPSTAAILDTRLLDLPNSGLVQAFITSDANGDTTGLSAVAVTSSSVNFWAGVG